MRAIETQSCGFSAELVETSSTSKQPVSDVECKTDASELPCEKPTTNQLPVADAEQKTVAFAKSEGR